MDDDDAFLYGEETGAASAPPSAPQPAPPEPTAAEPARAAPVSEGESDDSDESVRVSTDAGHRVYH